MKLNHLTAKNMAHAAGEMISPSTTRSSLEHSPYLILTRKPGTCLLVCSTALLLVTVACLPLYYSSDVGVLRLLGINASPPATEDRSLQLMGSMGSALFSVRETYQGVRSPSPMFLWEPAMEEVMKKEVGVEMATETEMTLSSAARLTTASNSKENLSAEAQASLNLARDMSAGGKPERALKILLHALALSPKHPDVLNAYGEYLEQKNDVVLAEHMYCRALTVCPRHDRAIANRQRTLPLVEEMDQKRFDRIDRKRDLLVRVPETHPGLRRMVQESYFRHIYHTTAMEGNTFTLSQTRSFVETRVVVSGKGIVEHNEILGMEAAFAYLNSSLIKRLGAVTVGDIVEVHRRVLGYVDPIGAGSMRTTQVFVGDFVPPPAYDVPRLVSEFVDWLNSDEALALHPIEMAALAHYRLVYVHPFYDGNGRTSRLLMNLVLMQTGYPPIIVPVEEKQAYYRHLRTANDGDVRPFIRFIARCAERTIEEFLWASVENINRTFPEISLGRGSAGALDRGGGDSAVRLSGDEQS